MKIEKISNNRAKFTFVVQPSEFEHALDHSFNHVKADIEVKGFRKGKLPRNIYENKFGVESLYEEAINHVIHHKFEEALGNKEVVVVSSPKVDLDFAEVSREKEFTLTLEVAIKPDVILGTYKGIEVKKENFVVTDEEVNASIQELLATVSTLAPKKTNELELGDTAIFDFDGYKDDIAFEGGKAENYQLKIGSNQFIPGFETQMVGLKVNEEKDIHVTFPEEYQAEELAGAKAVFKVKLHEIKIEEKPILNDDFVQTLERENITTVDQLKDDIRQKLTEEKAATEKDRVLDEIIKVVCETSKVNIPIEMIDQEANQLKENVSKQAKQYGIELEMFLSFNQMTVEQFEAQIKKDGEIRVLQRLVIEAIGKAEKITATNEEIDEKYLEIEKMYEDVNKDEIRKHFPQEIIVENVVFNKTIDFLSESAKRI